MCKKSEKGAVLVVSFIILVVMTVIGLAGMEITGLEEKMAGNARDRNIAFQAAEAALREGEDYLESQVLLPAFDGSQGLYALTTDGTKNWEGVTWTNGSQVRLANTGINGLAATPAYIIESLESAGADDSLEVGGAKGATNFYRITARAVGQTDSAEVILQSVYKR
ncbi:pilus assembly PilX family protein [Aliamphritea ceti]|uniref:pilus assembly PilX family protein n=1 Tax=Aliamphritea ceti TaxID=1524258 RepID=UPI0021C2E104|nr:PilX N-terminal domain-containing pilus assembly protein [Aliamphritea ceti]